MKSCKFEKLSFIESRDDSRIDFENKYDIFIEIIYSKLSKKNLKKEFDFNFNYNFNFKKKM